MLALSHIFSDQVFIIIFYGFKPLKKVLRAVPSYFPKLVKERTGLQEWGAPHKGYFSKKFFRVLLIPHASPSKPLTLVWYCHQQHVETVWKYCSFFGSRLVCSAFWHSQEPNMLPELDHIFWKMRANLKHFKNLLIFERTYPASIIQ